MSMKPSRYALSQSKARIFVGQLEPYVTEQDLFPIFSAYGRILHLNVVRHSTTVTPNEERRIPTAFVWYESTVEADAAIAALHNVFTFSSPDEEEGKRRYIQVSYADKTPESTPWGRWQKRQAEMSRRNAPQWGSGNYSGNCYTNTNLHAMNARSLNDSDSHAGHAASSGVKHEKSASLQALSLSRQASPRGTVTGKNTFTGPASPPILTALQVTPSVVPLQGRSSIANELIPEHTIVDNTEGTWSARLKSKVNVRSSKRTDSTCGAGQNSAKLS